MMKVQTRQLQRALIPACVWVLGLISAVSLAPQAAAAGSPPVVVSPALGSTLPEQSTGPLVIDFATPGAYQVSVECGDSYSGGFYFWSAAEGSFASYSGRQSFTLDPLGDGVTNIEGKTCTVEIDNGDYPSLPTVTSTFTVMAPSLQLSGTPKKGTFFPLVKDGYHDTFKIPFVVNRFFDATLTILDRRGKTVYAANDRSKLNGPGEYYWIWNGKTTHGKRVLPGTYKAVVEVTARDGSSENRTTRLRVATKTVTRTKKVAIPGSQGNGTSSGTCSAMEDYSDDSMVLSCAGSGTSEADYSFSIPKNATNIRWKVVANRTDDDLPRGSVIKRGVRVGTTKFRVQVKVTGQRALEIAEVSVSYRGTFQI